MPVEMRWGIIGKQGLYVGQWLTRDDAIREHVVALYGYEGRTERQYQAWWRECRERGDRPVKLRIEYDDARLG